MSGIACLFDRGRNDVGSDAVEAMSQALSHRGPDGSGVWCDETVGLAHQQLQATPESAFDDQPVRDGDLVVVADARLDNRGSLIDVLSVTTPPDRLPDSELLLEAYREWGTDCVTHLVGAFAFVVWDADTGTVFSARDHFGVKPLYYYESDDLFAVGSEPKALLSLPTLNGEIDDVAVADFLLHDFEDTEHTYFESVRRLPPAHAMTVTADDSKQWQYWSLDPTRTVTLESDAAYERRFRELFEQAVGSRLRTNGTVGADLSGGLDSTAVTVVARDLLPDDEPLHTFSSVFEETPVSDEREFFETVTGRDGICPHRITTSERGVFGDRERVLRYFDHPPYNTMHFAKWARLEAGEEAGITAHLTGEMGDSAVGTGLDLLPQLLRTGRLVHLYRELDAVGDVVGAPTHRLFIDNALRPFVPSSVERLSRRLRGERTLVERANPTLDPSFVEAYDLEDRHRSLDPDSPLFRRSARRSQHRSLTSGRITATLETVDMMHAPFGVEPRHPFTDVRLVEFALAMPPTQQLADGYTRSILRRSLGDLLPDKIQWRPWKAMLGAALWDNLAEEDDALRRLVEDPGPLTAYLDPEALRDAYEQFNRTQSPTEARALWKALVLSAWLEEYDTR